MLSVIITNTTISQRLLGSFADYLRINGWKMPSIDDLVIWSLHSELYQDKLNFYKDLIDVYRTEIDIELNKAKSNNWVIDW